MLCGKLAKKSLGSENVIVQFLHTFGLLIIYIKQVC